MDKIIDAISDAIAVHGEDLNKSANAKVNVGPFPKGQGGWLFFEELEGHEVLFWMSDPERTTGGPRLRITAKELEQL